MADSQDKVRLPRLIAPKSLPEQWRIVFNRDPIQFIDLLGFNMYLAGQYERVIPVVELRQAFMAWLEWHDKCNDLQPSDQDTKSRPSKAPKQGSAGISKEGEQDE